MKDYLCLQILINMMTIRPEQEKDLQEIYRLIQTAFETAKVSDGDEQDFAVTLRNSPAYIPGLALVAEQDGQLIGHIMLTRIYVNRPVGMFEALLLAPVSVLLEYRDQGVGSGLINESIRCAVAMGYKAVFLAGDPGYYTRFGFIPSVDFGIKNENGFEDKYILAKELIPNALYGIGGSISLC
jgi:putative acetyltransferase